MLYNLTKLNLFLRSSCSRLLRFSDNYRACGMDGTQAFLPLKRQCLNAALNLLTLWLE